MYSSHSMIFSGNVFALKKLLVHDMKSVIEKFDFGVVLPMGYDLP